MTHNFYDYDEDIMGPIGKFAGEEKGSMKYEEVVKRLEEGSVNGAKPFKATYTKA